jgi:hypothetical protein
MSDDHGSGASDIRDQIHAIGGQLGLTYVPWSAALNVKFLTEYYAEDRFQGNVISVTVAVKAF